MVGEANGGDVEGGGVALCVPRLSSGVASAGSVVLSRFAPSTRAGVFRAFSHRPPLDIVASRVLTDDLLSARLVGGYLRATLCVFRQDSGTDSDGTCAPDALGHSFRTPGR